MELLAPPTAHERHLQGALPPVVPVPRRCRRAAQVECHTMRRGHMRIERQALNLPASRATMPLDPAVDARRRPDRRSTSGRDLRRVERPDPRPGDGPRHDDGRRAADQPRDRRARRRRLVREPAALRRLRRDVAHPLRHRAPGQAAEADARRLPDPRDRGVPRRSRRRSTKSSSSATRRCATCSSARTCTRSGRTRTGRSPRSTWPRAGGRRPA